MLFHSHANHPTLLHSLVCYYTALHPPTFLAHPHTLTLPPSSSYTVQFFAYSDISLPTLTHPYTPFHTLEHYYTTLHAVAHHHTLLHSLACYYTPLYTLTYPNTPSDTHTPSDTLTHSFTPLHVLTLRGTI